jgi:predicted dehydrogenase
LDEIELASLCDMRADRLNSYGERFNVSRLYQSLEDMLEKERPDILHIVAPPSVREEPMEMAAKYGVRGIIVEKPLALSPKQAAKIKEIADRTGIKIALNTQRRYFQTIKNLKGILDEGRIGRIEWIRCVTKGNILSMGPHMVDLLFHFTGDKLPVSVWSMANGINGEDYGHPAPANMMMRYVFPGGVTAYCEDAEDAVGTPGEEDFWQHLEFNIWGSEGRAWWVQNREWGYQSRSMPAPLVKQTSWVSSDVPGQREFTRAMAAWLDGSEVHLNNLDTALCEFDSIMAAFVSAESGKSVAMPAQIPAGVVESLEARLR